MGFDWEQVLDADGKDLATIYDRAASDALYQDHPRSTPPGGPVDPGDDDFVFPFDET